MDTSVYGDQFVQKLIDAQPQPVFWMSPLRDDSGKVIDFQYRYCNEEMYRFTGLSAEQLLGKTVFTSPAISKEIQQPVFEQILDVYLNGTRMQNTIFNARLNRYYGFTRTRVEDGVLTVLQDRNDELRMIQELEQQKNLLDNILRTSPTGISVTEVIRDEDGRLIDGRTILANEAAVRFSGISEAEFLRKTARQIHPGIASSKLAAQVQETLSTGSSFQLQFYIATTGRWMELTVSKMDDNHLVNVFSDITNSKLAELENQRKSLQLNSIFNTAKAGMFTLVPVYSAGRIVDFRFNMVNQSVASYIGEKAENIAGALGSVYFPAYKENGLFEIYADTFENDRVHHFDFHYEDGYDVFFNIHTIKTGDEVLVTFTDHTTLKRLQRELESSIAELQRSNANLEEFAYAASHDLKEPIRKIHFFSDRLREEMKDKLSENEQTLFNRMQLAASRMGMLIDDLLMYSQASMRPKIFEEVDLNAVVETVLVDLELEIEQKAASISVQSLPVIVGHQRQLQQLFQNLVGNALKYMQPGLRPEVTISCREIRGRDVAREIPALDITRSFFLIEVEDNGIGFEEKDQERIFNVFQRLHGNSEYKGSGVGLAIARKVATNHEGYLFASGIPGEGAVFSLLLPDSK